MRPKEEAGRIRAARPKEEAGRIKAAGPKEEERCVGREKHNSDGGGDRGAAAEERWR